MIVSYTIFEIKNKQNAFKINILYLNFENKKSSISISFILYKFPFEYLSILSFFEFVLVEIFVENSFTCCIGEFLMKLKATIDKL